MLGQEWTVARNADMQTMLFVVLHECQSHAVPFVAIIITWSIWLAGNKLSHVLLLFSSSKLQNKDLYTFA